MNYCSQCHHWGAGNAGIEVPFKIVNGQKVPDKESAVVVAVCLLKPDKPPMRGSGSCGKWVRKCST